MKIIKNKKFLAFFTLLVLTLGIFIFGYGAQAQDSEWAGRIVGGIIGIIISALGIILVLVIKGLIFIASYQHFIDSQAVVLGWVIVRDVCNMFFVIVLMIIAFGTILHLENYSYKKWLPKLVLMAVLINFSKTICGLLIDVSQVVMLTFVNAFKDVGGANMINILGISDIVTLAQNTDDTGFWAIVGAYVLGLIYIIIAIIVITTMLAMLVMRLVMIWIYVVLSPLAYLLAAFPGGDKYASRWWSDFTKALVVGPVLAFFIWLSFAALQTGNSIISEAEMNELNNQAGDEITSISGQSTTDASSKSALAGTKASTPGALIKFIVAIGMLIGGLRIAQEIGGDVGSIAGEGMKAVNKGKGMAIGAGKFVGKWTGQQLGDIRDTVSQKIGIDLDVVAAEKRRREQVAYNRKLKKTAIRDATLKQAEEGETWFGRKAALLSTGDVAWQNIIDKKFRLLTAGSPTKAAELLEQINKGDKKKSTIEDTIKDIQGEKNRVITNEERRKRAKEFEDLNTHSDDLVKKREIITESGEYKDLIAKEKDNNLSEAEEKQLIAQRTKISKFDADIATDNAKIKELNVMTIKADEIEATRQRIKDLDKENEDITKIKKSIIEEDVNYKELTEAERNGSINPTDRRKLAARRKEIDGMDKKIKTNNEEKDRLRNAQILVADDEAKEQMHLKQNADIAAHETEVKSLNNNLKDLSKSLRRNQLSEIQSARASVHAEMEGEANKKVANFTNPDQLVGIFHEAVEQHDIGLMSAVYKKLARTGNYNELHRDLNIGTGYDGMIDMSKYLQENGGMTKQDSRALVAEIGEICKSINHFEAFGAMTMNKAGQWEESGKDKQEAAILAEKSKVQVQQFVRAANRLGNGSYQSGKPHTAENWELSRSSINLFASKDHSYAEDLTKTGNINFIQFIGSNKKNLDALRKNGAREVADAIESICAKANKSNVSNPLDSIKNTL